MSKSKILEWDELSFCYRLALKMKSQRSFLNFTRIWFELIQGDEMLVNWHHRLMARKVDAIIRSEAKISNLALSLPPGGTKTEFMSIHLPAYTNMLVQTGELDRFRNMNLSYADSLTKRNSRRTRDIISSREYQELWPCTFGVNQAEEWEVINGKGKVVGSTVSRSMGGQITGGRGGYYGPKFSGAVNLDDPDKPEDMFSAPKREASQRKTKNTVRSRRGDKSKEHPTPFLITQQRLHIDDTIGFVLRGGLGVEFDQVIIPAVITPSYLDTLDPLTRQQCLDSISGSDEREFMGEPCWSYWPEMEHIDQLLSLYEQDEYTFFAQYMQAPRALGGNLFKPEHFVIYGEDEEHQRPFVYDHRFITMDTAQKTKSHNDYSVLCEWGMHEINGQKAIDLINMKYGKWEAPDLEVIAFDFITDAFNRNSPLEGNLREALIEDKSSGTGLIQALRRRLPCDIVAVQVNNDKVTRAMDALAPIKQGRVRIPADAPWLNYFLSQHGEFSVDDSHKHDDIVDNTTMAVNEKLNKNVFDMSLLIGA